MGVFVVVVVLVIVIVLVDVTVVVLVDAREYVPILHHPVHRARRGSRASL